MNETSESSPDEYEPITYHHWQEFEIRRLKGLGDDFQQLFENIMVRARPGFVRVRPYGNIGDRKCDGLFRNDSIFFQVYSPDELEQAKVQKKIDEDLDGAVAHWGDALKTWSFVYNVRRGVPPDILGTLQEKQKQYPDIKIDHLSNDDLWEIARSLSVEQRNEILGLPPPSTTKTKQPSSLLVGSEEYETKWQEICRELLNHWKGLTTNILTKRNGVRFQLDEIFVPLGMVERQQKPKHRFDGGSPEQGSEFYEEKITPISQDDFFEQVLRQRQSKTSQGNRIAIIGEPGAGKTTQLQKIGDWILKETDGIPIWISLAAIGTKPLREYLLNDWLQTVTQELEIPQRVRDELGELLKTGKAWLLLDGVDEMAIADALHQVATQMREGWLQKVRVVLTCRLNVWDVGKNALDGFDVYRNLDFDYPTQVHKFIDKWFVTEPESQQKLKLALEQPGKERIRDMVKNPLRLTLLCYSWHLRQGELPETKAGLYEWFTDTFYEWNKGKVSTKLSIAKRKELNHALGELAKAAIDQASSRFCLREKFVNPVLGDVDDEESLFYLALQLGWLNCVGVAEENLLEDVYAFFHPTFQEYFAALAIEDCHFFLNHIHKKPNASNINYRVFEPQWREVVLLWLGRSNIPSYSKERLFSELLCFQDNCGGFYSFKAYFLAAEGIQEIQHYSDLEYEKIVLEIIKYAFGYFDKRQQKWCFFMKPVCQEARKLIRNSLKAEQTKRHLLKLTDICPDSNVLWDIANILERLGVKNKKIRSIYAAGVSYKLKPHVAEFVKKFSALIKAANDNPPLPSNGSQSFEDDSFKGIEVTELIQQLQISEDWFVIVQIAENLQTKTEKTQLIEMVTSLKFYLPNIEKHALDELEKHHFRCEYIYETTWYCAQNMGYSDFYQAWHTS